MNAHEHNPGLLEDRRPSDDRLPTITAPGYETTTTLIAPGETLLIVDDRWVGALIFVTVGSIQLECHDGATYTFPAGSILGFSDFGLRAAHNNGASPATIVGTRRVTSHRTTSLHLVRLRSPAETERWLAGIPNDH